MVYLLGCLSKSGQAPLHRIGHQSIIIISRIYAHFVREAIEGGPAGAFLLGGLEAADDVLECSRHHKVLLLQTKFFPLKELQQTEGFTLVLPQWRPCICASCRKCSPHIVVGVENTGDVFCQVSVQDSLDVVPHINCRHTQGGFAFRL